MPISEYLNFSPSQDVNFHNTDPDVASSGKDIKISYHFHESSFNDFQSSLTNLSTKDRNLFKAILTEKYNTEESQIPQDVLEFLNNQSTIPANQKIAEQLFIFLDLTAGRDSTNSKFHTGVNMNMFETAEFRDGFFKSRQNSIIVEEYPSKQVGGGTLKTFRGVPYADMSSNHIIDCGDSTYKLKYTKNDNGARELVANSYINALKAATDFLVDKDDGLKDSFINLAERIKKDLENPDKTIEFTLEEIKKIQQAAVAVKIGMAKQAGIDPILMPPGAFAGPLEFKERNNEFLDSLVKPVFKELQEHRAEKVIINKNGLVILSAEEQDYRDQSLDNDHDSHIVNSAKRWWELLKKLPPFKSIKLALDKCSANVPMQGLEKGLHYIASGHAPDPKCRTTEESINGCINQDFANIGDKVQICVGAKVIGETTLAKKTKCSFSTAFYKKPGNLNEKREAAVFNLLPRTGASSSGAVVGASSGTAKIDLTEINDFCKTNGLGDDFNDALKQGKFKITKSFIALNNTSRKLYEPWNTLCRKLSTSNQETTEKITFHYIKNAVKMNDLCQKLFKKGVEDAIKNGCLSIIENRVCLVSARLITGIENSTKELNELMRTFNHDGQPTEYLQELKEKIMRMQKESAQNVESKDTVTRVRSQTILYQPAVDLDNPAAPNASCCCSDFYKFFSTLFQSSRS